MLRLIFFGILAYFLFRLIRKIRLADGRRREDVSPGPVDEMVQDPNCLTYIPKGSAIKKNIGGETRFFCSQACVDAFRQKNS